jgi:hypothetical protein
MADDDQTPDDAATERAGDGDALLSRLRLIEDQPLASRAPAFAQLHDELQHRLEGGDSHA